MRTLAILLLLTSVALAQQAPPIAQALSEKLIEEINANVQLRVRLLDAQAKIKSLEEKDNAKQDPKAEKDNGGSGPQPKVR